MEQPLQAETLAYTETTTAQQGLGYRMKVLVAAVLGYAMDGFDMLILSFVMTAIMSEFGLGLAEGGMIATITLAGAVLGGYVFGLLADYWGRVRVFSLTIIIFSVFTGLTALAGSLTELSIYRFLAGLGLGGEFGIGMTLVAETWPRQQRAKATAAVAVGWQLGVVAAALITTYVLHHFGWRAVFVVGSLPALFAAWSRYGLAEPLIWQKQQEQRRALQAKKAARQAFTVREQAQYKELTTFPLRQLFADRRTALTTLALTIMTSVQNMGYYGIMIWLPTMLMKQHGLSLTKTSEWMVVTVLGMIAGILLFGYIADRLGRRPSYMLFQVATAAAIWLYAGLTDATALLFGGAILGFFCNGMMAGYGALLSEHYATSARSTAENFIFNTGRAVGGLAPVCIGVLAATYTLSGALASLAFLYIGAALTVFFLLPESKDRELA